MVGLDGAGADAGRAEHAGLRASLGRLHRLQSVTAALSQALTSDQVAEVIITQGVAALDASIGLVAALSDDGATFRTLRLVGYPPEVVAAWRTFPFEALVALADAVRSGEPVVIESLEDRLARYPGWTVIEAPGADGAVVCLPLRAGGRAVGGLSLSFPAARRFDAEERAFMRALADLCAQALDRARLYDEEQRARLRAETAVRLRDDILTMATHDLRSPLAGLQGRAQLVQQRLRRDPLPDRAWLDEQMRAVRDAAAHMLATIEEMSDVARLHMGQDLDLERAPVDVGALARAVVADHAARPGAPPLDVEAGGGGAEGELVVYGDVHRLRRVLHNLVGNAIKYSPEGTPVAVAVRAEGDEAVVVVRDRGVGIPADELPRIFTRFYRASTARGIAGTGIGLSGARSIVEGHGGTIAIESDAGPDTRGTAVTVRLPRATDA